MAGLQSPTGESVAAYRGSFRNSFSGVLPGEVDLTAEAFTSSLKASVEPVLHVDYLKVQEAATAHDSLKPCFGRRRSHSASAISLFDVDQDAETLNQEEDAALTLGAPDLNEDTPSKIARNIHLISSFKLKPKAGPAQPYQTGHRRNSMLEQACKWQTQPALSFPTEESSSFFDKDGSWSRVWRSTSHVLSADDQQRLEQMEQAERPVAAPVIRGSSHRVLTSQDTQQPPVPPAMDTFTRIRSDPMELMEAGWKDDLEESLRRLSIEGEDESGHLSRTQQEHRELLELAQEHIVPNEERGHSPTAQQEEVKPTFNISLAKESLRRGATGSFVRGRRSSLFELSASFSGLSRMEQRELLREPASVHNYGAAGPASHVIETPISPAVQALHLSSSHEDKVQEVVASRRSQHWQSDAGRSRGAGEHRVRSYAAQQTPKLQSPLGLEGEEEEYQPEAHEPRGLHTHAPLPPGPTNGQTPVAAQENGTVGRSIGRTRSDAGYRRGPGGVDRRRYNQKQGRELCKEWLSGLASSLPTLPPLPSSSLPLRRTKSA